MFASTRISWAVTVATLAVHFGVIWGLDALPGQDLPQHLAIVRILAGLADPTLPFGDIYVVVDGLRPYTWVHHALAAAARLTSPEVAMRTVFSVHAVAVYAAFFALTKAPRILPLAALLVWSPVACMGFLQFSLALAPMLFAIAVYLNAVRAPSVPRFAAFAAAVFVVAAFHVVAASFVALFVLVHLALNRAPRVARVSAAAIAICVVLIGAALLAGSSVDAPLQLRWSAPRSRLVHAAWTLFGPYRPTAMAAIAGLTVAALLYIRERPNRQMHAALAITAIAFVVPWGVFGPDVLTFIDLRLMTLAFALALASTASWTSSRATIGVSAFAMIAVVHFAVRARTFAGEARELRSLLARAEPRRVLQPIVWHHDSDAFASGVRLTHFLGLYYTVDRQGLTTQLWVDVAPHLPIRARRTDMPRHAHDWHPERLEAADLASSDYVLVQRGEGHEPVTAIVERQFPLRDCSGRWCLYKR